MIFYNDLRSERKKDDAKHPCFNILPVETSPPHINMVRENIVTLQVIDPNNAKSKCIKKGLRSLLALYKLQSTITLYQKELLEIHLRTGFITIIHNASPPFLLEIELTIIITVYSLNCYNI